MPVSKSGKLYFTDMQFTRARECSALEYAREQGYDLVRDGSAYRLREHDSMVFKQTGGWFWNSRGLRGRAIEFIIHYEGRTLPEAVQLLVGSGVVDTPFRAAKKVEVPDKKLFELPERAPQLKQLFAYLCSMRKLDFALVRELVQDGRIYESVRRYTDSTTGTKRELHNAVFLSLDENGVAQGGFQRGLCDYGNKPYKREIAGSDKEHFAFCIPGRPDTETVAVFEASIDAISHATLEKWAGGDYRTMDRLALGGNMNWGPLLCYLRARPAVRDIRLCLDSDAAGIAGIAAIQIKLDQEGFTQECGYQVLADIPTMGKDWNDHLIAYQKVNADRVHRTTFTH